MEDQKQQDGGITVEVPGGGGTITLPRRAAHEMASLLTQHADTARVMHQSGTAEERKTPPSVVVNFPEEDGVRTYTLTLAQAHELAAALAAAAGDIETLELSDEDLEPVAGGIGGFHTLSAVSVDGRPPGVPAGLTPY